MIPKQPTHALVWPGGDDARLSMDTEILQDYLLEARELLEKAQEETLRLEVEAEDKEVLASLFRAFHTIKGGASFLEATNLVNWAHHLETLLDRLRSHALPVTSARIDAILKGLDVIDGMLQQLAQGQNPIPGPADLGAVIQQLAKPSESPSSRDAAVPPMAAISVATPPEPMKSENDQAEREQPVANPAKDAGPLAVTADTGPSAPALAQEARSSTTTTGMPAGKAAEVVENSLRIDAHRLDAVMNQVGELVLLRNRLASAVGALGKDSEAMSRIAREMDLTVNDLQNTVMHLRMQPCKRLFQQLPRVVRDVSRQLGKDVRLEIVGEDVEIDKTVVDSLSAPLTHLIRNSLDHGIETPGERTATGKSPTALLRVLAIHLGDKVRIEVSDDGKGIDRRAVTQKAVEKGVITPEQAANLSEQDALELIFRPGFSTKETASDLSGRGVGMDVVKQTTQKLRGRIFIDTHRGQGTTVAMEFPLTMAVLPVLYLRLRGDIYALPIASIDSLIDLEDHRIHRLAGRVTYRVSGTQTVPLVDLGAVLQDRPLRVGNESIEGVLTERGLFIVSEVLGNEDSVVKPIDFLNGQNLYQGATISGRGNVVLILDAGALSEAQMAAVEGSN
ncbi:MAG: chemotaxis protein CheA [Candidatus Korobacteraceae bacterium]